MEARLKRLGSVSHSKYHCLMVKQKGVKMGLLMEDYSIDSRVILMDPM